MKCRYNYCKNNGEVNKEDAIKVGAAYYCKECYEEKENKVAISNMVKEILPREVTMNINKCIADWIHKKGFNTQYVLYTLDYIKRKSAKLNSVYGVIYYLNNTDVKSDYECSINMKKYKELSDERFESDETEVKFTYKSSTGGGWCKIL